MAAADPEDLKLAIDTLWLMLGGCLVFFMHSGFALLEVGSVSVRNTQNILFKNILSPTIAAILFWGFGYSIAYGNACDPNTSGGHMGSRCFYVMADGADLIYKTEDGDGNPKMGPIPAGVNGGIAAPFANCTTYPDQAACLGAGMSGYIGKWYAGWFFQWAFCATASTIVSGAVAERVSFKVYIIITIFLTGFIYPVVCHWGWSADGWASAFREKGPDNWASETGNNKQKLFHVGVIDFAGSGIVHMVGGVAALVSAWMIGPRHGRFVKHYILNGKKYAKCREQPLVEETEQLWMEIVATDSGEQWCEVDPDTMKELVDADPAEFVWASNPFPCQSATFQTFGCLILWFGWYGFNGASTLGLAGGYAGIAAKVMVNTTMAAAAGALTVGLLYQLIDGVQDLGSMSNGILAGLVSITSACSTVEPWAAIVCGIVGGIVYYFAVILLEKLRIDDVVLAVPVHCFCGIWGVIAAGLFPSTMSTYAAYGADGASASDGGLTCGLFYGATDGCNHGGDQLAAQIVFVLAIIAWVGSTTFVLLFVTKLILGAVTGWTYSEDHPTPLAYNRIDQMYGMDVIKHGGMAAPETKTVHDEPTIATGAPGDTKPRKRRSSVVGQTIMPAAATPAPAPEEAAPAEHQA